jgi:hypothetical protein
MTAHTFILHNFKVLYVLLLTLVAVAASTFEKAPRVLVHKSIVDHQVIIGKETTFEYILVNLGDADAKNIQLKDIYNPKVFKFIENVQPNGSVLINIPNLGIGKELSYNVTLVPKIDAVYSTARAEVNYYNGAVSLEEDEEYDEEDLLVGQSSTIGKIYILSEEEYLNSSSAYSNIKEMIYFILLGGLSIAVPMVTWLKAPQTTSVMKCL